MSQQRDEDRPSAEILLNTICHYIEQGDLEYQSKAILLLIFYEQRAFINLVAELRHRVDRVAYGRFVDRILIEPNNVQFFANPDHVPIDNRDRALRAVIDGDSAMTCAALRGLCLTHPDDLADQIVGMRDDLGPDRFAWLMTHVVVSDGNRVSFKEPSKKN